MENYELERKVITTELTGRSIKKATVRIGLHCHLWRRRRRSGVKKI